MSLGLKQLVPNPWENIREKYPINSKHTATVRNITNFGVFAELEEGVEGLVHISDLSWNKIKHPSELVAPGDKLDVVIPDFDEEGHKLSLGHKQLLENPWDKLEKDFPVGAVVTGTVANVGEKAATITLAEGVEATCPIKELAKEDGSQAVAGESLDFKVIDYKRNSHKLTVSHLKTYAAAKTEKADRPVSEAEVAKKTVKKINDSVEKTTLGDIDALAALKAQLEK